MEFVFVAPREELFPTCYPQGFQPFRGEAEAWEFQERLLHSGFFVERARAERTPAWKQVIPYSVVQSDGRVLLMRRRAKGGEARLHDKLSIGVGGHINPEDQADSTELFARAARREISEELEVRGTYELRLVGFLNDDSNPVGAVHLGLIHAVTATSPVGIRERDVLDGSLMEPEELLALQRRGEDFETWSSTLLAHLDAFFSVQASATL